MTYRIYYILCSFSYHREFHWLSWILFLRPAREEPWTYAQSTSTRVRRYLSLRPAGRERSGVRKLALAANWSFRSSEEIAELRRELLEIIEPPVSLFTTTSLNSDQAGSEGSGGGRLAELYINTDIETDGSIREAHSILSVASVTYRGDGRDLERSPFRRRRAALGSARSLRGGRGPLRCLP